MPKFRPTVAEVVRQKRALQNFYTEHDFYENFSWERHWLHVFTATAVGTVALAAILVYVIVKRRRKAGTPLTPNAPKIHCPAVAIDINPSRPQPILPTLQPVRIKARGLLERRGSSASLTIDLNPADTSFSYGSPPKECSAEEYLISAGNRMTRRQLRSCLKAPKVLHQEFLEIPFNHPNKLDIPGCSNKNRYRSIWPNEWTRVKLASQSLAIPPLSSLADPSVNYINANYIRGYDGAPRAFIATQGPLPNTINDFWAMIWQEKCPCVVMMTKLKEKNKVKCEPYLPLREEQYGRIFVTVSTTMPKNGYYVRDIELKKDDETHRMKHFWFTGWPDHKAPTSTANQLLELVKSVDSYRVVHRQKYGIAKSGPITVHCSAGIGRSGCFIATSIGCQQLREENMVDALGLVCQMRLDRGGMIQTPEQYEFVHHALSLYEKQLPETPTSAPMALTSSSGEASENASPSS